MDADRATDQPRMHADARGCTRIRPSRQQSSSSRLEKRSFELWLERSALTRGCFGSLSAAAFLIDLPQPFAVRAVLVGDRLRPANAASDEDRGEESGGG